MVKWNHLTYFVLGSSDQQKIVLVITLNLNVNKHPQHTYLSDEGDIYLKWHIFFLLNPFRAHFDKNWDVQKLTF